MKHVARLGLSIWSRGGSRTRQAGGFRSHVGRMIPSSTNDLRFHRGPIMSEAIPAVEPRPKGHPVWGDPIVHEWSSFPSWPNHVCRWPFQRWNHDRQNTLPGGIPSSTNDLRSLFASSLCPCPYIYIYEYTLAANSEQITFSNFSKCCVFDISTRTFSDRYQLMETMFCVFLGSLFSSSLCPCPYKYIHINILLAANSEKITFRTFQSAVFLTFRPALFLTGTN